MTTDYRTFLPDDATQLAELESRACAHSWSAAQYRDSVRCGHQFHGLFASDQLQGFAVTQSVLDEAELLNIVIDPRWQGQGLGKQLLRELRAALAASGARRLFLEVRAGNAVARSLYSSQGFVENGRRKNYYPCADGREDAILMETTP
ncbi:ribosomal protein S18-alanine N-acetyltransferase [Chromobacterium haemolyticum]|uniref:ribosomal protein S18-alanine N-acetyltransferase n=1 Tax=Chromobacterium haemolyticum TaxID=394935 RepID=UPI0009D93DBB|nr:ribosomal protein S18-alanine N-acetyltransferase [Chromobacterium haemolyticum]OQS41191.1 ribosomal-protein-alanine N-acetyltransferase [Chromobacterium haemolyticum]